MSAISAVIFRKATDKTKYELFIGGVHDGTYNSLAAAKKRALTRGAKAKLFR